MYWYPTGGKTRVFMGGGMDRISNLPEPIIHHIMSFLNMIDLTQTSILSKRFRSLWASYPNIDFDQTLFEKKFLSEGMKKFLNYVYGFIQRWNQQQQHEHNMHKFRLQANMNHSMSEYRINKAICFAVAKGVKELDLDIQVPENYVNGDNIDLILARLGLDMQQLYADLEAPLNHLKDSDIHMLVHNKVCYALPHSVYSAKSISCLKLKGFKLDLNDLILGCPLIENLSLARCNWLKEFKVSSSRLKTVELECCDGLRSIEIEASNLQSFRYTGKFVQYSHRFRRCNINVTACKSLKILSIEGAFVSDEWVSDHVFNLPLLEVLELISCEGLRIFKFLNVNLEKIKLELCHGLLNVDIEVPSLQSFRYNYQVFKPSKFNVYKCKFLKNLSVESADITDEWVEDHVSKLVWLESLELRRCKELKNVKVSNTNLRRVELDSCNELESIEIEVPNLCSFLFNKGSKPCKINIAACRFIKDLTLKGAGITDEWLQGHVYKFLQLENLRLDSNYMLKRINIFHKKLRSFHLLNCCENLVEVNIDTPELLSFMYSGEVVSIGLMNTPNLLNPTLSLNTKVRSAEWFFKLREFLVFFDHCKALTLCCASDKDLIFPDEVTPCLLPPLYDIRHLRIEISPSSRNCTDLVDSLLWLCPNAEALHIVSGSKEKSIKFRYDKRVAKEDPLCCRAQPIKCWRHYLEIVEMDNFEDGDDRDRLLTYFSKNAKNLDTIVVNRKAFKTVQGKYLEQS